MSDSKVPGTVDGVDPEDRKKEKKSLWERIFNTDNLLSTNLWLFILVLAAIMTLVIFSDSYMIEKQSHRCRSLIIVVFFSCRDGFLEIASLGR